MEQRDLLISIIDTAILATNGLNKVDLLIADLLAGADVKLICSQILRTTNETREDVQYERSLMEHQLVVEA